VISHHNKHKIKKPIKNKKLKNPKKIVYKTQIQKIKTKKYIYTLR